MAIGEVMRMKRKTLWTIILMLAGASLALGAFIGGMVSTKDDFYRYLGIFSDVLSIVRKDYVDSVRAEDLIDGASRGLLTGLDPHSSYLSKDELQRYLNSGAAADGEPGLECLKAFGYPIIVSVYAGSAAEAAGVALGDQILAIDGKSTRDLSLIQCRQMLAGKPDTECLLSIIRMRTFVKEDVRVERKKMQHSGFDMSLMHGGIGYLKIYDLERLDSQSLATSLKDLEKTVSALLMDVRSCTLGDYVKASAIASFFMNEGPVLIVEQRGAVKSAIEASGPGFLWKKPVYVLINSGTAGPAEAIAISLRERADAIIIGEKSYGIGLQQELIQLKDGSGIILSTKKYMTPEGTSWNRVGIHPSVEIRSDAVDLNEQRKEQLEKAFEYVRKETTIKKAA